VCPLDPSGGRVDFAARSRRGGTQLIQQTCGSGSGRRRVLRNVRWTPCEPRSVVRFSSASFLDQTWMVRPGCRSSRRCWCPSRSRSWWAFHAEHPAARDRGPPDLSGAGTAFGTITQLGPVVTVARRGRRRLPRRSAPTWAARTIREEIDAMAGAGHRPNPTARCPKGFGLHVGSRCYSTALVCAIGLLRRFMRSPSFLQGRQPGARSSTG